MVLYVSVIIFFVRLAAMTTLTIRNVRHGAAHEPGGRGKGFASDSAAAREIAPWT